MKPASAYARPALLLGSIVAGLVVADKAPELARQLRPLGDLFLNLLFTLIVPLVFFAVASSFSSASSLARWSRIVRATLAVFLATSLVASLGALVFFVAVLPLRGSAGFATLFERVQASEAPVEAAPSVGDALLRAVSVGQFSDLLTHRSMLPLVVFSAAVGFATLKSGSPGEPLARAFAAGRLVFLRLIDYVMWLAPFGLFAYFASTMVDIVGELVDAYTRVFVAYYVFGALYFVAGFSAYAWLAGGRLALSRFWAHMLPPSATAVGTCSSMATLAVNLEAAPKMGVPRDVVDVAIPLGAVIHKDGSVIGGVAKILFAWAAFNQTASWDKVAITPIIAILVGVVMGGIPSGGLLGELLILSAFGFPPETLPLLAVISVLIDPLATLLNATGDNVAAMLATKFAVGDVWRGQANAGRDTRTSADRGS